MLFCKNCLSILCYSFRTANTTQQINLLMITNYVKINVSIDYYYLLRTCHAYCEKLAEIHLSNSVLASGREESVKLIGMIFINL